MIETAEQQSLMEGLLPTPVSRRVHTPTASLGIILSFLSFFLIGTSDLWPAIFPTNLRLASVAYSAAILACSFVAVLLGADGLRYLFKLPAVGLTLYALIATVSIYGPGSMAPAGRAAGYVALVYGYSLLCACLIFGHPRSLFLSFVKAGISGLFFGTVTVSISAYFLIERADMTARLSGPGFLSSSSVGRDAALATIIGGVGFLARLRHGRLYAAIAAITASILLLTVSKSSIIGVVAALLVAHLLTVSRKRFMRSFALALLLMGMTYFAMDFLEVQYIKYTHIRRATETFTGRTILWEHISNNLLPGHWWFGFGYHSPSVILDVVPAWGTVYVGQSHSAYWESLLSVGIIGTIPLYLTVVATVIMFVSAAIRRRLEDGYARTVFCILVFLLVRSFSEGSFAQAGTIDIGLLAFCVLTAASLKRFSPPRLAPRNAPPRG